MGPKKAEPIVELRSLGDSNWLWCDDMEAKLGGSDPLKIRGFSEEAEILVHLQGQLLLIL